MQLSKEITLNRHTLEDNCSENEPSQNRQCSDRWSVSSVFEVQIGGGGLKFYLSHFSFSLIMLIFLNHHKEYHI